MRTIIRKLLTLHICRKARTKVPSYGVIDTVVPFC